MVRDFRDRPLEVVGISRDISIEAARKIVNEHKLPWRQVIEGKGAFHPLWQALGPLNDYGNIAYVVVDRAGILRFGGSELDDARAAIEKLLEE